MGIMWCLYLNFLFDCLLLDLFFLFAQCCYVYLSHRCVWFVVLCLFSFILISVFQFGLVSILCQRNFSLCVYESLSSVIILFFNVCCVHLKSNLIIKFMYYFINEDYQFFSQQVFKSSGASLF